MNEEAGRSARGADGDSQRSRAAAAAATRTSSSSIPAARRRSSTPLFDRFEEETGTKVEVRYGDSAELAATIAEEGDNSPADVFFAQDPGSLGSVDEQLAVLPDDVLQRVDQHFRDDDGRWVGTSGRARVIVYNTDELTEDEVPDSVFGLTDPKWKGKIGIAPTNASFQAFVTAMRLDVGDARTRTWLEDVKKNDPKFYEKNTPVVEAVASGEIQVGLVNHYYLYLVKEELGQDAPIENKYLPGEDPGALVSVAGAGVLEGAEHEDTAEGVRQVPARGSAAALLHRGGRGGRDPARARASRRGRACRRSPSSPAEGRTSTSPRSAASSSGPSSC